MTGVDIKRHVGGEELVVSSFRLLHADLMIPEANIRSEWWLPIYMENLRQLNARNQPGGATLPLQLMKIPTPLLHGKDTSRSTWTRNLHEMDSSREFRQGSTMPASHPIKTYVLHQRTKRLQRSSFSPSRLQPIWY